MLFQYMEKVVEKASYKIIGDGTWFAEIPGFQGVWANGATVEECRKDLLEVLEEWLILKLRDNDPLPKLEGVELRIREAAVA